MQTKGVLYAVFTALMFAFLAIVLKYTMKFASPGTVVFFRFFVAFIGLFLLLAKQNQKPIKFLFRPPGQLLPPELVWPSITLAT
jgi:drug/metabolite transporter (DMT)-like permease